MVFMPLVIFNAIYTNSYILRDGAEVHSSGGQLDQFNTFYNPFTPKVGAKFKMDKFSKIRNWTVVFRGASVHRARVGPSRENKDICI